MPQCKSDTLRLDQCTQFDVYSAIVHSWFSLYCCLQSYDHGSVEICNLLLGRLRRVDLITWVRYPSVRPYVRPYVRLYVSPSIPPFTKSFSDSDEIWCVGRGRWVMQVGMPYDPIKVKVTRPLKLKILRFSKSFSSAIFNVSWQMTTDSETMEQYLTFVRSRFLISLLVFVSRDFELGRVSVQFCKCFCYYNTIHQLVAAFWGVDRQFRTGLVFVIITWLAYVVQATWDIPVINRLISET